MKVWHARDGEVNMIIEALGLLFTMHYIIFFKFEVMFFSSTCTFLWKFRSETTVRSSQEGHKKLFYGVHLDVSCQNINYLMLCELNEHFVSCIFIAVFYVMETLYVRSRIYLANRIIPVLNYSQDVKCNFLFAPQSSLQLYLHFVTISVMDSHATVSIFSLMSSYSCSRKT